MTVERFDFECGAQLASGAECEGCRPICGDGQFVTFEDHERELRASTDYAGALLALLREAREEWPGDRYAVINEFCCGAKEQRETAAPMEKWVKAVDVILAKNPAAAGHPADGSVTTTRSEGPAEGGTRSEFEIVRPNGDALALLHEWLDTELDPEDEEYGPWMESFTARVEAVLAGGVLADGNVLTFSEPVDSSGGPIGADVAARQARLAVGNPRAAVRDALGVDTSLDAYHNLDGALIDLRRMKADAVCVRTIERVLSQIAAVLYLVEDGNERQALICEHYSRECSRNPPCVGVCLDAKDARENGRGFPSQGIVQPLTFKVASPVEFAMAVRDGKRFEGRDGDVTVVGYLWRGVVYINGTTEVSDAEAIKEFKDRFPPPPNPRAPMMKESDRG